MTEIRLIYINIYIYIYIYTHTCIYIYSYDSQTVEPIMIRLYMYGPFVLANVCICFVWKIFFFLFFSYCLSWFFPEIAEGKCVKIGKSAVSLSLTTA